MPGNYTLELELFSLLNGSVSDFEIYADGALLGGYSTTVSSAGSTISVSVPYGGVLPTSLEFRFTDTAPGSMDTIEVRAVKINDRYVNTGNYLSGTSLNDGGSQTVDVTNNAFLFDASEPSASEFTTGATQTYTAGADTYRDYTNSTPQVFDMLGGRDVAYLGDGDDKVNGNGGNDILHGRGGADLLYGAAGDDRLFGGDGDDTLYGGDDNDRIQGDAGDDEIHGGAGVDRLIGGANDDVITGGTGNDTLLGGSGDDYLFGDGDDDTIIGGTGADTIDGGSGADIAYGGAGIDHINGGDDDDILIGNGGNDVIHGDGGDDTILGLQDDDTLFGGAGDDTIFGGSDNDTIYGGNDNDILHGENGSDTLNGGDGDDALYGDLGTIEFASGLLVIEAENYETSTDRGGKSWATVSDATASGGQVMRVDPNTGTILASTGIENTAAELTYTVNFTTTGTFYVWIKAGVASGGSNDSVHLGFDGVQQTGNGGVATGSNYGWHNTETGTGTVVTVNVATVGNHTLNLWMREDGTPIDKIIIADTAIFTPTGNGPGEGTRVSTSGGIDTINGGAGDDRIYGDFGDDVLDGGADNDSIYGGAGIDTIDGGSGNDNIYLANGDFVAGESIDGGANTDVLTLTDATTVDFTTGTLTGLETLTGSAGNDTVTIDGTTLNQFNNLNFDGGTNTLNITSTSTGLNSLANGSLSNLQTISASTAGSGVTISLAAQTEAFTITGGTSADTITTGTGNDTVTGGLGNDVLDGAGGTDTVILANNWSDYNITLSTGIYTLFHIATGETDTATNFENFTFADIGRTTANIINAKPVITSNGGGNTASISIAENGTAVTTVTATDAETPGSIIYSISGGIDSGLFSITAGGILTFTSAPDFEAPLDSGYNNIYDVQVTATDGDGKTDTQSISVQVTDVAEGDVGSTPGTAGTLPIGGSVTYDVSAGGGGGDHDWFAVTLTNGVDYAFWARGTPTEAGTASDPRIFNLYESDGTTSVGADDDSGVGYESLLTYTATYTGTYYIDAGTWGGTGSITLSAFVNGNRQVTGGGSQTLTGTTDSDYLESGNGNDTLNGLGGSDILWGENNDDILNGGAGADVLYGGSGADTFVLWNTDAADSIVDFTTGQGDVLDISAILVGFDVGVDDIDDFLQFTTVGGDTSVSVDVDGLVGGANFANIAMLEGNTGEVVQTLYDNGDIIV